MKLNALFTAVALLTGVSSIATAATPTYAFRVAKVGLNATAAGDAGAQPGTTPPAPPTYSSCQAVKAGNPGAASGTYSITPGSMGAKSVYCDMTSDGGGWTKLASATGSGQTMPTVAIDDMGLAYTQVLLSVGPGMAISYSGRSYDFKFDGVGPIDGLRFGTTWYFMATTPAWRGYGASSASPFDITLAGAVGWANSNYSVVQALPAGGRCLLNGGYSADGYCGLKMRVAVPSGQRLTAYNDLESVVGNTSDNSVTRNVDIYVR